MAYGFLKADVWFGIWLKGNMLKEDNPKIGFGGCLWGDVFLDFIRLYVCVFIRLIFEWILGLDIM